jgi:hypothetical protein
VSNYCARHGHEPSAGTHDRKCLNCGVALPDVEPGDPISVADREPIVADGTTQTHASIADAFQGDGKPNTKPSNPKDAIGATKLPVHLVPTAVVRYAALAHLEGALKYGKFNWRVAGVRMSIYLDAMQRHMQKLTDGEWFDGESLPLDPETGEPQGTRVPHLGSIIACCGIILDAFECGLLTDDRPPVNPATAIVTDGMQANVRHLQRMFKDYTPHQHVITDARNAETPGTDQ